MADLNELADAAQIALARAVGERSLRAPRAVAARYLPARDRVEIDLASGWSAQVPRSLSARLAQASPQECEQVEIVDSGLGLHWTAIDEDWYVPAVIESLAMPHAAQRPCGIGATREGERTAGRPVMPTVTSNEQRTCRSRPCGPASRRLPAEPKPPRSALLAPGSYAFCKFNRNVSVLKGWTCGCRRWKSQARRS